MEGQATWLPQPRATHRRRNAQRGANPGDEPIVLLQFRLSRLSIDWSGVTSEKTNFNELASAVPSRSEFSPSSETAPQTPHQPHVFQASQPIVMRCTGFPSLGVWMDKADDASSFSQAFAPHTGSDWMSTGETPGRTKAISHQRYS